MPRPKKGEKGCEEATNKWRETMLKIYGSEEAFHNAMVEKGRKGGKNGFGPNYTGGFASSPELAKIAGAKGGKISKRGPAKKKVEEKPKHRFWFLKRSNNAK